MERNRQSDGHSPTGDRRRRDLSGHGKKPTKRRHSPTDRRGEGLVRTRKESDQEWGTHFLEIAKGGTCHNMERKRLSDGHSLAPPRPQRKGLVRTWKESNRVMGTHFLEAAEGGTCQDTEIQRPSYRYSPTGDHRGRDLSGHGKKLTE